MNRNWILTGIAATMMAISACDETTEKTGYSLISDADRFTMVTDTIDVETSSFRVDSVLTRSEFTYLGRIQDPETGTYITCDYTTQFNVLENEASVLFANRDSLLSYIDRGVVTADSVILTIVINSYQGDSLAAMKLQLSELARPISEEGMRYSNFDPEAKGYLRTEAGAIKKSKVYSMSDLTLSDSTRNVNRSNDFYEFIRIPLNEAYTDRNNRTYAGYDAASGKGSGYGTYLMQTYYEHPEYFKNSNAFVRNVCPGFYIKCTDGLGVMTEVAYTQLNVYYSYQFDGKKYVGVRNFNATPEVLQATHVSNNKQQLDALLAEEQSATFLKTPAGIFTEVTLPVERIKMGPALDGAYLNDSLTSAKITFYRMKEQNDMSDLVLEEPENLLLVERDSLFAFFESGRVNDNIGSYLATYNATYKTYTFSNISNLINRMWDKRGTSANWNKAVLVPVQLLTQTASTYYSTTTTVVGISNEMNINSVRLVNSQNTTYRPRIAVIYNKNK